MWTLRDIIAVIDYANIILMEISKVNYQSRINRKFILHKIRKFYDLLAYSIAYSEQIKIYNFIEHIKIYDQQYCD